MLESYSTLRHKLENNEVDIVTIVENTIEEIKKSNYNAFIHIAEKEALEQAKTSQENFKKGTSRKLEGLIIGIKDNISTKDIPTTCASKMLENYVPVYDATVIERLKSEGAIIIGKTNLDEFAMGSSNENSYFGDVLNPINEEYVPGGSSGGSAAATIAGLCHVSLGSETGGSVRQPASFTNQFGYKPSYGRISRYGLVAFASSLDQIGIFSKDIKDLSLVCDVITGEDKNDATSLRLPSTNSYEEIGKDFQNLTMGVIADEILEFCSDYVLEKYNSDIEKIEKAGIKTKKIPVKFSFAWIPTYYIIATAEASSNLARFDGVRFGYRPEIGDNDDIYVKTRSEGFGEEVKRRIMLGTYVLSSGYYDAYYKKAQQVRRRIYDSYKDAFEDVDFIYMPTTPTSPFKLGAKSENPLAMYKSDYYTASANLAGVPAINIPSGTDKDGLPFGMQIQCDTNEDEKLISLADYISKIITD